ncbi:MAG: hypothetical protein GX049_00065 [Alcaligenaceae bacterium]|nr:hypothetical protein [Alcaligenaceae bacterium]
MRFFFLVAVLLNLGLLAYGQGVFGPVPSAQGLEQRLLSERNEQLVVVGEPVAQIRVP